MHSFRKWSPEAEQTLRDCFGDTLHYTVVDCTADYINFSMDIVVPVRTVCCYPNNKPWITSDIKDLLNQKKRAFRDGDQQELKRVQRELKVQLREVKEQYKRKLEQMLQHNIKQVWNVMKKITRCSSKRGDTIEGDVEIVNQLKNIFNRFDYSNSFTPQYIAPPLLLSIYPLLPTLAQWRISLHPQSQQPRCAES
ncbi:hypothetical protein QTP70_012978 [Hemibagrus guttatus]|uniref:Uncharacterized protein n=1 Tax=Hemibagrus guttatus TaxID=175788 RepID=A0AAE0V1M1_9TELE|nr:hypothetical protein QTP70_012978 [Hemibagrus guttatus]KAK3560536.1 hypothetical protein QTP86_010889 [Hemibagrus guttatus]